MSAMISTMPVFGTNSVPPHAKLGITVMTSYVIYTAANLPPVDVTISLWQLVFILAGELAIGLTIGFATRLVFTAVQLAGQMIGFQMGFAIVNVMDPATNSQVSITAQFQNMLALMIFLTLNGHHWLLAASARSFDLIPLMGFAPEPGIVDLMVTLTKNVFVTAVKLGAPIMATLFLLNVALGLIARTVPQMNVFIVGFPMQIGIGLLMLGATAPIFFYIFKQSLYEMFNNIILLMRLM